MTSLPGLEGGLGREVENGKELGGGVGQGVKKGVGGGAYQLAIACHSSGVPFHQEQQTNFISNPAISCFYPANQYGLCSQSPSC